MAKASKKSPEEKLRVVLSVLRGELSAAAAGRRAGVSEQTVHNWKKAFLEGGRDRLAQRAQELLPEPIGLAVADVAAQDLPVAVCGDARGDDGGHRSGLGEVVAHVQIGGVQIHVRELDVVQAAGAERLDHLARPPQMRDTSDLEIPDSAPSAATRSSIERVETPATYASITTAHKAPSMRRRGSSIDGKKLPFPAWGS